MFSLFRRLSIPIGTLFMLAVFPLYLSASPVSLQFAMTPKITTPSGQAMQRLATMLNKQFPGKVAVSVYDGGKLGSEIEVLSKMKNGEPIINFIGAGILNNVDTSFLSLSLPFAFSSYDDAFQTLNGPFGKELSKHLLAKGFRVLAWWDIGFSTIAVTDKPIKSYKNFKGLRIRVSESPINLDIMKTLGMTPMALSLKNANAAFRQNGLDANFTSSLANVAKSFPAGTFKYVYWSHLTHGVRAVIIAESTWQKFSPELQAGIEKALAVVTPWQWARVREKETMFEKELQSQGATVVKPSLAEENQLRKEFRFIWERYYSIIGPEVASKLHHH